MPVIRMDGAFRGVPLAGAKRAENRRTNTSGTMRISDDPAEQAVCFRTEIPTSHRRAYPEYIPAGAQTEFKLRNIQLLMNR